MTKKKMLLMLNKKRYGSMLESKGTLHYEPFGAEITLRNVLVLFHVAIKMLTTPHKSYMKNVTLIL